MKTKKVTLRNIALASLVIVVCVISIVQTKVSFSGYATCRKTAMSTKGYAVWKHQETIAQESELLFIHYSTIIFSDGFNDLSCQAVGVGPFWATTSVGQTLVGCMKNLPNEGDGGESCPEGYFGVYP